MAAGSSWPPPDPHEQNDPDQEESDWGDRNGEPSESQVGCMAIALLCFCCACITLLIIFFGALASQH